MFEVASEGDTLWIGNSLGVIRFERRTGDCTIFYQPGLTRQILPIEDGKVFTASDDGIWYFDGLTWSLLPIRGKDGDAVEALGIDQNGDFWLQGNNSRYPFTYRFKGHVPPLGEPWPADDVAVTARHDPFDCDWWHRLRSGFVTYRSPEECRQLIAARTALNQQNTYAQYAASSDGAVWWAGDALYRLAADGSTVSQIPLQTTYPSHIAADPNHGAWLATKQGLYFTDGNILQPVSIRLEGDTLSPASDLAIDTGGTVWIATQQGLQRFIPEGQHWSPGNEIQPREGPAALRIMGLAAAPDDTLWIYTDGSDPLWHYADGTLTSVSDPAACYWIFDPRSVLRVTCGLPARRSAFWIPVAAATPGRNIDPIPAECIGCRSDRMVQDTPSITRVSCWHSLRQSEMGGRCAL